MPRRVGGPILTILAMGLMSFLVILVFHYWESPRTWAFVARHYPASLVYKTGIGALLLVALSLLLAAGRLSRRAGGSLVAAVAAISASCIIYLARSTLQTGELHWLKFLLLVGPYVMVVVVGLKLASLKAAYAEWAATRAEQTRQLSGSSSGDARAGYKAESSSAWLSPSGAAIAAVCFFLPWAKINCMQEMHITGAQLADMSGKYWIIFGAELAILIFWLMYRSGVLRDPRPYVVTAALVPLGMVAYAMVRMLSKGKDFELRLEFGSFGTIIGLICALAGAGSMRPLGRGTLRPLVQGFDGLEPVSHAIPAGERPGAMLCAACQSPVTVEDRFCARCGAKLD